MMKRYYAEGVRSRHAAELFKRERHDWRILKERRVLVAGAGGLGTFVTTILSGTGVGEIVVVDRDTVELSNLNRQFLYTPEDVGKEKAKLLEERLSHRPSRVRGIVGDIKNLDLNGFDVVVDALDEWKEKKALLERCLREGVSCVFATVGEGRGAVAVPTRPLEWKVRGNRDVSSPEIAVAAGIASEEALKILEGREPLLRNKLLVFDLGTLSFEIFEL